jgi:hypothetical protein
MNTNKLSFLTVTYERDFDLLERLLKSIVKHCGTEYIHYIILNDDIIHLPELTSILAKFPNNFIVKHYLEFPEMHMPLVENCNFGDRCESGWSKQIMLTLIASAIVESQYFLHLCSKDVVFNPIDVNKIIRDDKMVAIREYDNIDKAHFAELFDEFFVNAYKLFELDPEQYRKLAIRPVTPAIIKTKQIQDMLHYLNERNLYIIDIIGINAEVGWYNGYNKTCEYYLYSAWLAKNNLINDTLEWIEDIQSPIIFNIISSLQDLRRTN